MMNDYDFIKDRFEKDGVKAPDTLSADSMRQLLEAEADKAQDQDTGTQPEEGTWEKLAHEPGRSFWKKQLRYGIALAACLLVALVAIPSARKLAGGDGFIITTDDGKQETTAGETAWKLKTFNNEKELKAAIDRANSGDWNIQNLFGRKENAGVEEAMDAETTGEAAESSGSHAETFKQVAGVDEADVIKTDGEYIYHVNGDQEIDIFRAKNGKADKIATISRFAKDGYISSIYVDGDRLVSIGYVLENSNRKTSLAVYDITDREKPAEVGKFEQSGTELSSRMTDGIIYLVTRDRADYRHLVPQVTTDGKYKKMDIADVAAFPNASDASYAVVSAIDARSGEKVSGMTKAVLGVADDIYCNQEHLYLACRDYSGDTPVTRILKADLNGGELKWAATGKVRGEVYGQFAMDERDGNFRIATTSLRNSDEVNNLFVLDSELNERGRVTGFAKGEEIKAVRFIGKRAYVITYEQTDPLFVIDVSDPDDPRIDGEVKIDGFSSLLVPVEGDRLIGVGYINGTNNETEGVKLALFDVSDPSRPKVLDEKEFEHIESEAQYDHHALVQNEKAGYLAIPYSYRDYTDYIIEDAEEPTVTADSYMPPENTTKFGGVLVFDTDGNQIKVLENYEIKDKGVSRCTYIGDYIYAVTDDDTITGFKF